MAQVPHHQTSDSNSHHILKQKYFGRGLFFKEMTVWRRLIVVEELGKAIFLEERTHVHARSHLHCFRRSMAKESRWSVQ
jgi:hypothetical protein